MCPSITGFEEQYFEDPGFAPGLKGGDEVRGYGYYPDYFAVVEAQLSALIELSGASVLLDAGCGKGALAAYARRDLGCRVVGVDASRYAVRWAARAAGGEFTVRAAVGALPLASHSVDAVWCNGVLQYLEGDGARAALAEVARVARTVCFISNIAAAQRRLEWGRTDLLTHLYLRPAQWAALAAEAAGAGWRVTALPFEGESAILLDRPRRTGAALPLRFTELALERMQRLGALRRMPPGLESFRAACARAARTAT